MTTVWWVSSFRFTGEVTTHWVGNETIILEAPPVWKKFKGQPFSNLITWLRKMDGRAPGVEAIKQ